MRSATVSLPTQSYSLLDFGDGRKLERFGSVSVDRPAPAAHEPRRHRARWAEAAARYERCGAQGGRWIEHSTDGGTWTIAHGDCRFALRLTATGQVGLFPEQAANWAWIARQVAAVAQRGSSDQEPPARPQVLNLFAYTGAATLSAAAAGAQVAHVDAASSAVAWARTNARLSALDTAPIRWLVDDAAGFVARELRRGRAYDGVILDPPSYGHGPGGRVWRLADDLRALLVDCARLTAPCGGFVLVTCHTTGVGPEELAAWLRFARQAEPMPTGRRGPLEEIESGPLELAADDGRKLPCGAFARWGRAGGGAEGNRQR